MTSSRLEEIIRAGKTPVWNLDEMFWAQDRQVEYPLTHYDLETYEGCRREGAPSARAISDPGALLRHIEETWPDARLQINARDGKANIAFSIPGPHVGISGTFTGEVSFANLGQAIALAYLQADRLASDLQRRLWTVDGLAGQVPPYEAWPVEEVTPGRFGAVDHEHRLLCATANSAEGAARHATMNHKGDYGVLLCRERYEKTFPTPVVTVDDQTGPGL